MYQPFLHLPPNPDGRTCKCGSTTHLTVQSHACPLNPRNQVTEAAASDNSSGGDSSDSDWQDDHNDKDTESSDPDDDDHSGPDAASVAAPPPQARGRRRLPNTPDDDNNTGITIPPYCRPRRSNKFNPAKGDVVEVDFNGKWWSATIMWKYRGEYAVKYHDDEGNVEKNVPGERIRKLCS